MEAAIHFHAHAGSPGGKPELAQIALTEKTQHIGEKANHQHSAEPYACAPAGAQAGVAVVSSTQAETSTRTIRGRNPRLCHRFYFFRRLSLDEFVEERAVLDHRGSQVFRA